ncbi:MAG: hypothetical protein N2234_07035, partial [Planctomycetota bacterium]|nr:hypothetical protein [Planctomycetota bacterium]
EYIAFLDSDDLWLPDKLEKQLEVFRTSNDSSGIVYCSMIRLEKGIATLHSNHYRGQVNIENVLEKGGIATSRIMVRKSTLENIGTFDESLPAFEDWELEMRISKIRSFVSIEEVGVIQRRFGKGVYYNNPVSALSGLEILLDKYKKEIIRNKYVMRRFYSTIGNSYCLINKCSTGIRYFVKAMTVGGYIHLRLWFQIFTALLGTDVYKISQRFYRKLRNIVLNLLWTRRIWIQKIPKNIRRFLTQFESNKKLLVNRFYLWRM